MAKGNDKPKLVLKTSFPLLIILLALGVGLFGAITGYILTLAFEYKYVQLAPLGFALIFSIFPVYTLIYFFTQKRICVYDNYIYIKYRFLFYERIINFNSITAWAELTAGTKLGQEKIMKVYTDAGNFGVYNMLYDNYEQFKDFLHGRFPNMSADRQLRFKRNKKRAAVIFTCVCFSASALLLYNYLKTKDHPVITAEIFNLTDILTNKPEIENTGGKSKTWYTKLQLQNFPGYTFNASNMDVNTNKQFISHLYPGEIVNVVLTKEEFEKKITFSQPLTFGDKHLNYNPYKLQVYGMKKKDGTYIYFEKIPSNVSMEFWGYIFWMAAFIAIAIGILIVTFGRRKS